MMSLIISAGCQAYTSSQSGSNETPVQEEEPSEEQAAKENSDEEKELDDAEEELDRENVAAEAEKQDSSNDSNQKELVDSDKNILEVQRQYISEKKNPLELKEWMDRVIEELSLEAAAAMLATYEEYLQDFMPYYTDKLAAEGYQRILVDEYMKIINSSQFNGKSNMTTIEKGNFDIADAELRSLLDEIYEIGYTLHTAEGQFFPVIDYTYFTQYKDKVSDELYEYFAAMSLESKQPFASDAALVITWDELAYRINIHENYLDKYPNSIRKDEIQRYLLYYMQAYLLGLDNTSVFDYKSNKFREDLLESYQNSLEAYPDTELAEILSEYIKILEKNNYKQTDAVEAYQTELREKIQAGF